MSNSTINYLDKQEQDNITNEIFQIYLFFILEEENILVNKLLTKSNYKNNLDLLETFLKKYEVSNLDAIISYKHLKITGSLTEIQIQKLPELKKNYKLKYLLDEYNRIVKYKHKIYKNYINIEKALNKNSDESKLNIRNIPNISSQIELKSTQNQIIISPSIIYKSDQNIDIIISSQHNHNNDKIDYNDENIMHNIVYQENILDNNDKIDYNDKNIMNNIVYQEKNLNGKENILDNKEFNFNYEKNQIFEFDKEKLKDFLIFFKNNKLCKADNKTLVFSYFNSFSYIYDVIQEERNIQSLRNYNVNIEHLICDK